MRTALNAPIMTMSQDPLRVAVVGVGHLGVRHAEIYAQMAGVRLVAVCDVDPRRVLPAATRFNCQALKEYRQLFGQVDAVSLAVPTTLHGAIGLELLTHQIHLLVEKPIATSLREANALIRMATQHHLILQVGHVERFNAAIQAAMRHLAHPQFIEVHRLSPYPFRSTDISVVLDVMIHDLDLILALVQSPVVRTDAVGVAVLSASEDIANARLRFQSGCIANLTASRINDESVRRFRVFQDDSYLCIDAKGQTVELAKKCRQTIHRVHLPVNQRPPLQEELAAFVQAVMHHRRPMVSGVEGRAALALALRIEDTMRHHRRIARCRPSTARMTKHQSSNIQ